MEIGGGRVKHNMDGKSRRRIGRDVVDGHREMENPRTAGTSGTASATASLSDAGAINTAPFSPNVFSAVPDIVPYVPLVTTWTIRTQEDEEYQCISRSSSDSLAFALSQASGVSTSTPVMIKTTLAFLDEDRTYVSRVQCFVLHHAYPSRRFEHLKVCSPHISPSEGGLGSGR
jgi:hypothetical protein